MLLAQIGFDLMSCGLIASFVREQVSERAGTTALFLAALCPFTAAYSAIALTECLSVFAVSLALWASGRMLRAQAEGRMDRRALVLASTGMALAVLLRPDGALVSVAVVAAIIWYAWREGRLVAGIKTAALCGLLAVLPLAPWAVRNWRTFHVVQPLAPRRVNNPGEPVNYGFYRWMSTWSVDIVSTENVFWNVGTAAIAVNDLPARAFDSPAQRAQTAAVLAEYNINKSVTPALDARFRALADERLRAHPLLCRVWVPALRVADMVLRPRTETLDLDSDWWHFPPPPMQIAETIVLGLINVALVAAAVVGVVRRRVPWVALMVAYAALRCALLSTMENSEPRYTLELLPMLMACAACWLRDVASGRCGVRLRLRRSRCRRCLAREDLSELILAVGEHLLDLLAHEEMVRQPAYGAKGQFVFDHVGDEGDIDVECVDAPHMMAVVPRGEGSSELVVAKAVVPDEVANLGLPADADRAQWERPEAESDART